MNQEIAKFFLNLAKIIFALGIVSILLRGNLNTPALIVNAIFFSAFVVTGIIILQKVQK